MSKMLYADQMKVRNDVYEVRTSIGLAITYLENGKRIDEALEELRAAQKKAISICSGVEGLVDWQ